MAKSIKLNNETYIDSSGVIHNQNALSVLLNSYNDNLKFNHNETEIGTWLGKPLYRKVISLTPTSATTYISHEITNLDKIINAYGNVTRTNGYRNLIPCNYTNWEIFLYDFNNAQITLKFSTNQWNSGVKNVDIVLEYTKQE